MYLRLLLLGGLLSAPRGAHAEQQRPPGCEHRAPSVRFRSDDGAELSYVMRLLVDDARRRVLVLDWSGGGIKVLDSKTGRLVAKWGQAGEGPGEFRTLRDMGKLGDTVWVSDAQLRRLTLFSRDGALLGTIAGAYPGGPDIRGTFAAGFLADGSLLLAASGRTDRIKEDGKQGVMLYRRRPGTEQADTMVRFFPPELWQVMDQHGRMLRQVNPFSAEPKLAIAANGSFWVLATTVPPSERGGEVRVVVSDVTGVTTVLHVPYQGRRVPQHVIDSVARAFSQGRVSQSVALEALGHPVFFPPVAAIIAGADGSIWMQWTADTDLNQWLGFSRTGRCVALVDLPIGARVVEGSATGLWAEVPDSDDVPHLIQYLLDGPKTAVP